MAGFIVTMSDLAGIVAAIRHGAYGTLMSPPSGYWRTHHEGTFADFASMTTADDIYFFCDRRVYGIGRLVEVGGAVAHGNTVDAHVPEPFDDDDEPILPSGTSEREIRFFCTFAPGPAFFTEGVDMDDLLESSPSSFRMLRVLERRSFVKVDDQENQALRDMILRRAFTRHGSLDAAPRFETSYQASHASFRERLGADHRLSASNVIAVCSAGASVRHEMALEAGLVQQLSARDPGTSAAMGEWDYIAHQVPASPFKPIKYMDFIDVFGYRYLPRHRPTIAQFLVAELKREIATADDVLQLLKYVDWVRSEYAAGDYGLISAYLIAYDFTAGAKHAASEDVEWRYIVGRRPAESHTWRDVALLRYAFEGDGLLHLTRAQ